MHQTLIDTLKFVHHMYNDKLLYSSCEKESNSRIYDLILKSFLFDPTTKQMYVNIWQILGKLTWNQKGNTQLLSF